MLEISAALELDPTFFLNLGRSSIFIVPLFIASSIWVPVAIKALKLGKYYANKYLWYTGNKFFTTMANCSSSLGLLIICAALALHLVMKVEKDSFGSCLVVSRSLLVISTSTLYMYCFETFGRCPPNFLLLHHLG